MKIIGDGDSIEKVGTLKNFQQEINQKKFRGKVEGNIILTSDWGDVTVLVFEKEGEYASDNGFLTDDSNMYLIDGDEVYMVTDEPALVDLDEIEEMIDSEEQIEKIRKLIDEYDVKYIIIHN